MTPRIAVVYHSRGGIMRALAMAAAEGARAAGGEVRTLRVADHDPHGERWPEPPAGPADVLWAQGLVLATPTYFGNVSSPFKRFLETTSPLWNKGMLADRVVTGMTSSNSAHGGREATLLALYQTAFHWGAWVIGADPTGAACLRAGGNPYGVSAATGRQPSPSGRTAPADRPGRPGPSGESHLPGPVATEREAARDLGSRLTALTAHAHPGTPGGPAPDPVRMTVVLGADDGAAGLLARQTAAGARSVGAQVRLRRVGPVDGTRAPGHTPVPAPATPQDISWADTVVFGAAVRLGAMAAPLLDFIQSLEPSDPTARGPLWGKPAGGFVTVPRPHAGSESAPLALNHLLLHSGAVVVTPGFTDPSVVEAGGTPYGVCHPLTEGAVPTPAALAAAAHQGRRTALAGDLLRRGAGRGAGKGEPHERAAV